MTEQITIGIIAFQGGISEHIAAIKKLGFTTKKVLSIKDLENIKYLIIPGGESTVIGRFLEQTGLKEAITKKCKAGKLKIWGTCAGAILLGKDASPYSLQLIDISLKRNAYGKQIDSFEKSICIPSLKKNVQAVFIRAPKITKVEKSAEALAYNDNEPILCRNKDVLVSTFHPELTGSLTLHKYFINNF